MSLYSALAIDLLTPSEWLMSHLLVANGWCRAVAVGRRIEKTLKS